MNIPCLVTTAGATVGRQLILAAICDNVALRRAIRCASLMLRYGLLLWVMNGGLGRRLDEGWLLL